MKLFIKRIGAAGNALLVTLVISSVLCVSIFGYLRLVEHQTALSSRSQLWNVAITVAEAGVEDAIEHLNSNSTNLPSQGWSGSAPLYSISNRIASGAYYAVIDYSTPA